MSKIILNATGKTLTCPICGEDEFYNEEALVEYNIYYNSERYGTIGRDNTKLEMCTCENCGWTTFFKNTYDIKRDSYNIEIKY